MNTKRTSALSLARRQAYCYRQGRGWIVSVYDEARRGWRTWAVSRDSVPDSSGVRSLHALQLLGLPRPPGRHPRLVGRLPRPPGRLPRLPRERGDAMNSFADFVRTRYGVLKSGEHNPNGEACVLEARNAYLGRQWSDRPEDFPDIRPLNDAKWSTDTLRTAHMLAVVAALWAWPEWSIERRIAWCSRIAERTIREILPIALRAAGLEDAALRCERDGTAAMAAMAERDAWVAWEDALDAWAEADAEADAEASLAAHAASLAAARGMAERAESAARVEYAGRAVGRAAWALSASVADDVLILACRIWVEEAQEVDHAATQ